MTSERTQNWVDGIVHHLISRAARRAPDTLSERLEEEWLADLAEQHGRLARLRFGMGCCWAINAIVREHSVAVLAATRSPVGHGHLSTVVPKDFPYFSTRTSTFLLIVCLHAAILYGLAIGLRSKFLKATPTSFETHVIEAPPRSDLPAPPRPQLTPTRIELPPQEAMPLIESNQDVVQETTPEIPHPALPASVPAAVNRVQGGPGIGFPNTNDFYPDASIRMGEKGIATVSACVDGKGRLTADPTIIQSTGSTKLDDGALKLAKAGSGHYRATTEDGQPVNSCYPFRIRFELRN